MTTSVQYLGYKIDAQGMHPTQAKIKAIKETCIPRNVTELKAYLGILTYYSKLLLNLSAVPAPLYAILQKDQVHGHGKLLRLNLFKKSKDILTSSSVLTHYNPDFELTLSCDTLQYNGLGAVLSHHFSSSEEKPIAFASHTLFKAEQNYSQIEREALVFGVQGFHFYLYG